MLSNAYAEQPPPPCHPNPNAATDRLTVANRGDIVKLPDPLKGTAGAAGGSATHLSAASGLCRSRQAQPALPVLFARQRRLRAQCIHGDTSGHQRYRPIDRDRWRLRAAHPWKRALGSRTEARVAHRSKEPQGIYRRLYRYLAALCHQQRERMVRGLDDPRPGGSGPGTPSQATAMHSSAPSRPRMPRHCWPWGSTKTSRAHS